MMRNGDESFESQRSSSTMQTLTYKADLWDKFNEIVAKMTIGKQNVKDLQALSKAQSDSFEYMAKQMNKTKILISDKNLYTCENSAKAMLSFTSSMGQKQHAISKDLEKMYKDMTEIRTELSKSLKSAVKEEKKLRSDLASARSSVASAKKKDADEKKNYQQYQTKLLEAKDLPPKKLQQLQNSTHKAEKSSQSAEKSYLTAYENLKKVNDNYYMRLGDLMQSLEILDRKRMNIVKATLSRYHQVQLEWAQLILGECDNMRQAFDQISPDFEIRSFIGDVKSGENPPPLEPYEPYQIDIPNDIRRQSVAVPQSNNNASTPTDRSSVSSVTSSPIVTSPIIASPPTPSSITSATMTNPSSTNNTNAKKEYVKANYDYQAQSTGELDFNEGDILEVTEKHQDGWWVGVLNGHEGLFPSNFVSAISESEAIPTQQQPAVMDSGASTTPPFNPQSSSTGEDPVGRCRALYDYDAQDAEELSFSEGADIVVYQKFDDGWWFGALENGQKGLFPSNFTTES